MKKCPHCGKDLNDDGSEFSLTTADPDALPAWIPMPQWDAFIAMRKKIPRAPWTPQAQKLLINKLDKLRKAGHDPAELLEAATVSSWRTVYEPRGNNGNGNGNYGYKAEREQIARVIGSRS